MPWSRSGARPRPLPKDLIGWCKDRLAGYKRPRSISILSAEEMPKTATGKIQHRLLKQRILEKEQGR